MRFSQLSIAGQSYMIGLYIICFTLLLITIISYIQFSKNKKTVFSISLFFIYAVVQTIVMNEINHFHIYKNEFSSLAKTLDKIPVWLLLIYGVFTTIYAVYKCVKLHIYMKTSLNSFSIKEAIENLPTGLAFATKAGTLQLSNRVLHKLSHSLTHKDLQNGEEFWEDLKLLQNETICVAKGAEPVFALPNGEVWQFSKTICKIDDNKYYQIKANNITEMYQLSNDLKDKTEKLSEQQSKLRELISHIEENVESQVSLNIKVGFHDNFGNLIALTKKSLHEQENEKLTNELMELWLNTTEKLDSYASEDYTHILNFEQIKILAEQLDCKLFIAGQMPKGYEQNQVVLLAINETLKNAVHHSKVKELLVSIKEGTIHTTVEIKNKNHFDICEIKEGGGLSGLRNKVALIGGNMQIELDEDVNLRLNIPKNMEV